MINRKMFQSWIAQMRFSILFPAILVLAGCSESNNTSISPVVSLQPVAASSNAPDPRKVERLINDFVEACIIHNDGQPAADPLRPNGTVRYLRERGYYTGFFDPNPRETYRKIYAEDERNWCGAAFAGVSLDALTSIDNKISNLDPDIYQVSSIKPEYYRVFNIDVKKNAVAHGFINRFELKLAFSGNDTIIALRAIAD